jgi:hypothetical protein
MDILRSKTPDMGRQEIYVHLMAYNLLRTLMWRVAKDAGICPVRVSWQGTRQLLEEFFPMLATAVRCQYQHLVQSLFSSVIRDLLPERPYRYELRVKKRRPKPFPRLQQPRHSHPCPTGV